MEPDDPRHGTYAGALAHCKDDEKLCGPCETARYRENKKAELRRSRGILNRIPLGQKAWHILSTHSGTQIAHATGIDRGLVYRLQNDGPERIVLRSTRDKILTVAPWTPIGVQRRLQALAAIGWSAPRVADQLGSHRTVVGRLRSRDVQFVRADIGQRVVDLYDEIHMQPLGAARDRSITRTINEAARRGWAPPLAWDDIDHDDEPLTPKVGKKGDQTLENYEWLTANGYSREEALEHLGITYDAITTARRRLTERDEAA